jgi:hypothetical protein
MVRDLRQRRARRGASVPDAIVTIDASGVIGERGARLFD